MAGGRAHKLLATVAGWWTVSPTLGAFAEYGGTRLANDAASHAQYVDAGIAVLPVPAIQLDLRVGRGVNGLKTDGFVGVGVSRRW